MLWNYTVSPDIEPYQISIEKGSWTDSARRNRVIPYKIYTPQPKPDEAMQNAWPLVVWSHGLGGSRDGAGFISRYIAAHGYVVVHIQHHGTDSSLWEGKPGHPWDIIRATHIPRRATLQRLQDVPFALDQITKLPQADKIDFDKLGFCGHSFGAMTTQVMAGQYRGFGRRRYSLFEDRIKAGILYSPVPVKHKRGHPPEDFYSGIKLPLLVMTGTADDSPLEGFGYEVRREVFDHSGGPEQHLLVLQDGDHMVFNGSRGQLGENPKRAVHEKIIKILSLAFWDAYIKGDQAAKDWLAGESVRAWLADEATYTYRP
jgi:dienelactone hydrolase